MTRVSSLQALEDLTARLNNRDSLIHSILEAQKVFIEEQSYKKSFNLFLEILLQHTSSEYGFIGEIRRKDKKPFLKTFAITNIAWNEETQRFFSENAPTGLEFYNLNTLFGRTLSTGEIVLSNNPSEHPHSGGIPEGHPDLNAYLGMPLKYKGMFLGMFGVANRASGYDLKLVKDIQPLIDSISTFIYGYKRSESLKMDCNNVACSQFLPSKKPAQPDGVYARMARGYRDE